MAPGIFRKCCKNCAILPNPLRFNGFSFDGLRTPTLKVAGSNPVGRTTSEQSPLCSGVFLCLWQKRRHPPAPLLLLSNCSPPRWARSWWAALRAAFLGNGKRSILTAPSKDRRKLCAFGGLGPGSFYFRWPDPTSAGLEGGSHTAADAESLLALLTTTSASGDRSGQNDAWKPFTIGAGPASLKIAGPAVRKTYFTDISFSAAFSSGVRSRPNWMVTQVAMMRANM